MAKEPQELKWIESLFSEDSFRRRGMFGGFAYYLEDKVVLVIFESEGGSRTYQKKTYPFDLWNGCMFPLEHSLQEAALQKFPFLFPHPILPKWLYLPLHTENFEELATSVMKQVLKPQSLWGSVPARKGRSKRVPKDKEIPLKLDTRRPRMFSDEPAEAKLRTSEKLSDLKNIGTELEKKLQNAGIKTVQKFVDLGWKKSWIKLVHLDSKHRHSLYAYTLIGALTNREWNRITDEEKNEARAFAKTLAPQKKLKKKL